MITRMLFKTCVLVTTLATGGLFMTACSSIPKNDSRLDAAHNNFNLLQAKANAGTAAPVELGDAQNALAQADTALKERKDAADINNKIYLAQQRVAIAEQAYNRKMAEQSLTQLNDDRDKLRLAARTAEAERAKAQLAELKELQAKTTDRGIVMTLGDVLFDVGKSTLKSGGTRVVDKLAGFLSANPQRKVAIEGFTDSTGSDELNQTLSENRAEAVKAVLVGAGISPDRIVTRGYGKSFPVAGNEAAAGRQLNRRVEIVLSDENGNIAPRG
ncbi:MAG: flagellar motor protein MotB [Verrucomicrobiaceae bacterium]|nr:flagellar motor protein MotB [Verrucomicrobiaceae bacterium]